MKEKLRYEPAGNVFVEEESYGEGDVCRENSERAWNTDSADILISELAGTSWCLFF